MDNQTRTKYIKSIAILGIFNGIGAILFLVAFAISKFQVFLWSGLFVLLFTLVALFYLYKKITKIKD